MPGWVSLPPLLPASGTRMVSPESTPNAQQKLQTKYIKKQLYEIEIIVKFHIFFWVKSCSNNHTTKTKEHWGQFLWTIQM